MSYPRFYQAVKEMTEEAALSVPMARAIVRRAGLRVGAESTPGPVSLVSAWISAPAGTLAYQWDLDLSPYRYLRLSSISFVVVWISHLGATGGAMAQAFDPGDYEPMWGTYDPPDGPLAGGADYLWTVYQPPDYEVPGAPLRWMEIREEDRTRVRLTISYSETELDASPERLGATPFPLTLQATP